MARKLNAKQEKFCKLYASDEEFFCNGVKSYMKAYGTKDKPATYNTARANSYNLLTKTYFLKKIVELIELDGLNDSFVDKQLAKLINQDADFKAKMGAIKEYNALKTRITKKLQVETPTPFTVNIVTSNGDKMDTDKKADDSVGQAS